MAEINETTLSIITNTGNLQALCDRLAAAPYITVDTEFMREKTYFSKLCLIQVASPDEAHIIDPLAAGLDLTAFWSVLTDAPVLKVLHSARQDFEIFYQASGKVPNPVFDTQVAAMVLGFADSAGYQTLVEHYCAVKLDKSSRFTDWSQRPLSEKQLKYAIGDVTYLRQIYERMQEQLDSNQRAAWLNEEMAVLTSADTYAIDPEASWRRLKHRSRDPKFLGVLKTIAAWRERTAQVIDIPRGRLVSDDALLQIAAQKPKTAEDLERIRGVSSGFAKGKHGGAILKALEKAQPISPEEVPERKDRSVLRSNPLGDLLKLLLKARAQEVGIAPKLIASAEDLDRLANTSGETLSVMHGWRYDVFGKEALALKSGRLALAARGKDIEIVELDD